MYCTDCRLCETRTHIVEAYGSTNAKVILVGEAPGANEDEGGEPFIGRSGKLLMKLVKEELGLDREDLYIVNSVQCRPPKNRNPKKDELEACKKNLMANLKACNAEVIITLGKVASGNLPEYEGKKVYSTYHPAAALYKGSLVEKIREDLKSVVIN